MIKRLICLLCVAVTAAACNRPRNIPDEKLIDSGTQGRKAGR